MEVYSIYWNQHKMVDSYKKSYKYYCWLKMMGDRNKKMDKKMNKKMDKKMNKKMNKMMDKKLMNKKMMNKRMMDKNN